MREMVLNHASLSAPDRQTCIEWLRDTAVGMASLVQENIVAPTLRASRSPYETYCLPNLTLFDAYLQLSHQGARDEYNFLLRLTSKAPLLSETNPEVADRFRRCEHITLPQKDSEPLVYCAITDSVAVGFPSDPLWDCPQITIIFDELLPDGTIGEAWETIHNLTRSSHARTINDSHRIRMRERLLQSIDGTTLWERRQQTFPNLAFGPDVQSHLTMLNPGDLRTVVNRLAGLDESAEQWQNIQSAAPPWQSKVTDEPSSVKNNPKLREARRFRSHDGTSKLFMWHARFGSSGRIHLRFDKDSYHVEIGYIGYHLPL